MVSVYRSTDTGAPVVTGEAGALVALLDACLVSGYGSSAPLGWSESYTDGGLKRAYQQASGSALHLFVDNAAPYGASYGYAADVRGYHVLTGVDTGPFPTSAQIGALSWHTSTAATGTAREWLLVGDGARFYLFIDAAGYGSDPSSSGWDVYFFGDILSRVAGDQHAAMIIGRHSTTSTSTSYANGMRLTNSLSNVINGHYMAMDHTGIGSAVQVGKFSDYVRSKGASYMGAMGGAAPDLAGGDVQMAPVWVCHAPDVDRGVLPGLWNPLHDVPLDHLSELSGGGPFAGRVLLAVRLYGQDHGEALVDITGPWE